MMKNNTYLQCHQYIFKPKILALVNMLLTNLSDPIKFIDTLAPFQLLTGNYSLVYQVSISQTKFYEIRHFYF